MNAKYDGIHFQVETVNLTDGTVEGHAAGCADLTRRTKNHADSPILWDCFSKEDVREGYNADFDEETDGWYDINWKPCANHIPATLTNEVETVAALNAKVGRKWTYLYAGDVLVAEIRNDQADAIAAFLGAR